MTTKEFAKILQDKLTSEYGVDLSVASNQQIYRSLALICRQMMSENHKKFQSKAIGTGTKQVYYLCMEFLMGRSLKTSLLNLGLESLHVRIPRHCENGLAVAKYLKNHDLISYVIYPGLEGDKYYETAKKYLPNGSCGVVSFGVKGGRKAAEAFMGHLKTAAIETHVADARTCCLHPASSTHRQMTDAELQAAGVPADMVRLSCGLENAQDLIDDIAQALEAIR
mgnify:CR=1 FL=1